MLLASIAGIDVGRLLIAGILPGLILALLYSALIYLQVLVKPDGAPSYDIPSTTWREKVAAVTINILPMGVVVFMVIGFIILGIATPTEAAAFGVLGVLILTLAFRLLSWKIIKATVQSAVKVAGMVFFIIINSTVFSQLLAYSGASAGMLEWATGFEAPTLVILLVMFSVLLLLGMFMDPVSMMLISVPIFFPLIGVLGLDPVWFGIFVLLVLEMSGTTPPFGLLLYIMMGVASPGVTLFQVAKAAFPFLVCDAILIGLLIAFPAIALYLPSFMN